MLQRNAADGIHRVEDAYTSGHGDPWRGGAAEAARLARQAGLS